MSQTQLITYGIELIRTIVIFGAVLTAVPFLVLLERVLLARIQLRVGPTRVGLGALEGLPFLPQWLVKGLNRIFINRFIIGGIFQTLIDGAKLFLKEEITPRAADRALHALAPILTIVPAVMVMAIIPFSSPIPVTIAGHTYNVALSMSELPIGILFYLMATGIAVYGITLAGWSSNNKYSLLGGIRSAAQMISYELALGLSIVPVLLIAGTFSLYSTEPPYDSIVQQQSGWLWNWYVFKQPIAFLLFFVAGFAETNRLPFDLPEGESELGGGFHTEYSSMKFAMFFMAEYMNIFTLSSLVTTLFLGGFQAPFPTPFLEGHPYWAAIWGLAWFSVKVFFLICFMIFIRGTLPRFRYDQLMDLGWKVMLPLALVNLFVTSGILAFHHPRAAGGEGAEHLGLGLIAVLFIAGLIQLFVVDRILTARRKRVLGNVA